MRLDNYGFLIFNEYFFVKFPDVLNYPWFTRVKRHITVIPDTHWSLTSLDRNDNRTEKRRETISVFAIVFLVIIMRDRSILLLSLWQTDCVSIGNTKYVYNNNVIMLKSRREIFVALIRYNIVSRRTLQTFWRV